MSALANQIDDGPVAFPQLNINQGSPLLFGEPISNADAELFYA